MEKSNKSLLWEYFERLPDGSGKCKFISPLETGVMSIHAKKEGSGDILPANFLDVIGFSAKFFGFSAKFRGL